jgi:hypothetical protein
VWLSRALVELVQGMPTWTEFAQCVVIAVLGLGVLLFRARPKRRRFFSKATFEHNAERIAGRRTAMRRGRFHGLRFQRRIRVLPGVQLNVSLSGVGVSVGDRGFHAGVTARGQRYVSAGLPGTGLSVRLYSPVNSSPKLSFWPLAVGAAILAVLLAVAVR